jgi:glyoxylase-like metal-dependent hydrolase (beta-lactamase superfamily II)
MKEILTGIYLLSLGGAVNVYFLKAKDGFTLIDAGMKGDEKRIAKALKKIGGNFSDIKRIIITHAHPDHVGALPELIRLSGAPVWIHELDTPVLRGEIDLLATASELKTLKLSDRLITQLLRAMSGGSQPNAKVDHELKDGEALNDVYPGLEVIHLPGHSAGQIGLWLEPERFLIGADTMMNMPWGLTMPGRGLSSDWETTKKTVHKLAQKNIKTLCLGHGQPLLDNAAARISALAQKNP